MLRSLVTRAFALIAGATIAATAMLAVAPTASAQSSRLDEIVKRDKLIVATFGTALDIMVAELAVESFFPADTQTAEALQALAATL